MAGPAAAGHHFVGDQEHAVAAGDFGHPAEFFRRVHAHAAGALDQRLDDHGRHRSCPACQCLVEPFCGEGYDVLANKSGSNEPKKTGSLPTDIAPKVSPW